MSSFKNIKELVIETCMREGAFPTYAKLTSLVLENFPKSKWQKTHYAWYKSQIKRGEIFVPDISESDGEVLSGENREETLEIVDVSLSLEKDLHSYLSGHVGEIENGLVLVEGGIEFQTDAGRIDILARDALENTVVIELKAGKAKDAALGQLLGYMGCITSVPESYKNEIRGILVASDFDKRVVYASKGLPGIKLVKYKVSFELAEVT